MKYVLRFLPVFLALLPAQAQTPYDASKPCRFYIVNKQPAPVRCLQELVGAWGSRNFITDGFVFRDKAQYLAWREREDFRRASGLAPSPPAPSPQALSQTERSIACPREIAVKFTPASAASLNGWHLDEREAVGRLDPSNPPHSSGAILTCYYAFGSQRGAFMLSRSAADGECTARADGTGFECKP